ncbi:hypothetical protein ACLKA7_004468 [Drosophila subpalustris]
MSADHPAYAGFLKANTRISTTKLATQRPIGGEAKEKLQQQEAWHLYCSDVYKLVAFSLSKVVEFQEFPEFVDVNVNLKMGLGEQRTDDRRQTMIQPRAGIISP